MHKSLRVKELSADYCTALENDRKNYGIIVAQLRGGGERRRDTIKHFGDDKIYYIACYKGPNLSHFRAPIILYRLFSSVTGERIADQS